MSAYEGVSLIMEGALFVVSLISLIVIIVKAITGQKNNHPAGTRAVRLLIV